MATFKNNAKTEIYHSTMQYVLLRVVTDYVVDDLFPIKPIYLL